MFFVDLRLPPRDLAAQMGDMRVWLDRHEIDTARFLVNGAMARLGFSDRQHAEAFAARFAGLITPDPLISENEAGRPDRNETGAPVVAASKGS